MLKNWNMIQHIQDKLKKIYLYTYKTLIIIISFNNYYYIIQDI